MVKFDEKGQGFWDFILEKCSSELIKAIEKDFARKVYSDSFKILGVRSGFNDSVTVYLFDGSTFVIHTEIKVDNHSTVYRDELGIVDFTFLNELMSNV